MKRAVVWAAGIVLAVVLVWAAIHVFISPVNPDQEPPSGHFDSSCWTCHFVTSSVEVTEPE